MEDGPLRCWGYNGYGQLGIGNTNQIDSTHEMGSNLQVTDIGDFVESAALGFNRCVRFEKMAQIPMLGSEQLRTIGPW
ncbi:MAG: hypothetical protein Ct9H90mP16_05030 [Candidatus Poseidoniales archaeon]|nr:MAG: hypothetical protein Ct9H90mP16_05030 [Candidatus Poseidoniales archaeon]